MSKEGVSSGSPLVLLSSRYIQKVDTQNRTLIVDLSLTELDNLPVYPLGKDKVVEDSQYSSTLSATQTSTIDSGEMLTSDETNSSIRQPFTAETLAESGHESLGELEEMEEPEVVEEELVRLLEERLIVNRSKRKVGEVVVRKEIETRIVEVPVQREILIVEQVGAETKRLAEIDLGQGEVTGVELAQIASLDSRHETEVPNSHNGFTVTGEFLSPKAASNLLEAIAFQGKHGCSKVRVELVVDNPELQDTYQKMFDRCSKG
jgi:stress response protein YsnF